MNSNPGMNSLVPPLRLLVAIFVSATLSSAQANPFAENVRKTEWLSPEKEQKTFHLPPGFEIQLVASEPQIAKPMNMAWDAKGRLWLTDTREYPYPVPLGQKGRDSIKILEDFDENGRARKITTFVEGLNVPIGIMPYKNGVLAFSIPNIYFFQDTDGDGRSDKEEVFLGRFGFEKDTHGMTSNFRRGYDGWMYADHGFNNDSILTAKDGSQIKMNSGNTYRIKIDGSHIEQFTWGQVNPFGLTFDPMGDLWSADCHSSPLYQLLRGAYYPSFGKPHDGLGYGPNICAHSHGSTAICGITFYDADNFPAEFRNNVFIGNVMTSRINRDSFVEHGSTRIAKEEPDFVSTDDPWFRPVDIQLGPDGAMYVADFYNRIIGHYEVPLDHPGRDRESGRIWRIVYKDSSSDSKKQKSKDSAYALPSDIKGLLKELAHPNMTRRMLAMNELTDVHGPAAVKPVQKMMADKKATIQQRVHGLWILYRLGALNEKDLRGCAEHADNTLRVHAMRVLSEIETWSAVHRTIAVKGLSDSSAYVQRAAADAIGRHTSSEHVQPLLELRDRVPAEDQQLAHTVRMALRNQLQTPGALASLLQINLSEANSRLIAEVAVGVKTSEAGRFLLTHVQKYTEERAKLIDYLRHAARYAPQTATDDVAAFTRNKFADDLDFQLQLFKSLQEGSAQRGAKLSKVMEGWGASLTEELLASIDPNSVEWRNTPIKGNDTTNPWILQERMAADGKAIQVLSSLAPGGEQFTGILRSKEFTIPETFSLYLCGHDGSPDKPPKKKNLVRLRDAETKKVLAEQYAPRNDTAQLVQWKLGKHAGRKGYLELVDADGGRSYAWIGAGRFDPPVVTLPKIIPHNIEKRQSAAAELAASLGLKNLEPKFTSLLADESADPDARTAAAKALVALNGSGQIALLQKVLVSSEDFPKLRESCAQALGQINSPAARAALLDALKTAAQKFQAQIALALASNPEGAEELLRAIEQRTASPHLLQESAVKDRVAASKPANWQSRVDSLTRDLTPVSVEKQKLIDQRVVAFRNSESSAERGVQIYNNSCGVCHQIGGRGALVGPQLDGIGNRGLERLLEDILDPNRNVDHAFRYSNVTLKDDQVISGLFRREEGELLVFVDATGKEVSVAKKEVADRRESENSLMPENFGDIIPEQDFNDLISYLLATGSSAGK